MRLYPLAYLAGLLPLVTIHITYYLAASHGQVPQCIPYIDSCTSISATGREPPAFFVFKGLMIPAAVVLMAYWLLNARWLREIGCRRSGWLLALVILGGLAGAGLIFYSTYLGAIGDEFRQRRHTGVLTFFGFTLFAQIVITWLAQELPAVASRFPKRLKALTAILFIDLVVGLANVTIGIVSPELYDATNNAFAWNFTLLLCIHVIVTAELWRGTGWRLRFATDTDKSA